MKTQYGTLPSTQNRYRCFRTGISSIRIALYRVQNSVFSRSPLSLPQSLFPRSLRSTICNPGHPHPMRTLRITNGGPERAVKQSLGREREEIVQTQNTTLSKYRQVGHLIIRSRHTVLVGFVTQAFTAFSADKTSSPSESDGTHRPRKLPFISFTSLMNNFINRSVGAVRLAVLANGEAPRMFFLAFVP